ncbi:MAG: hypothetical protein ACR2RF_28805 [Geminicoccaceae bacterium]
MTYLATEMLLYLLSTAAISLALGWLIWGAGRRRQLDALRSDLTAVIEQEKVAHHQTRLSLDEVETKSRKAIEAAKADAGQSLAKLSEDIDAERRSAEEVRAELEQVRAGIEETIQEGRESVQATIDQAMETANAERAAASGAMAREAQSRAQIEELRLLIGAEKLAAESARTELEQTRERMQAELVAERAAHEQAKNALNDIRSTLTRTLGSAALDLPGDNSSDAAIAAPSTSDFARANGMISPSAGTNTTTPFSMMTDMAAAGDALNNPDLDEADIEDQEGVGLDLSATIAKNSMTDSIEVPPPTSDPIERKRPAIFQGQRPDDGDDLQAIDGIGPETERSLHDSGCYHYSQLADLASEDIAWLAEEIGLSSDQIAADRWVEQAKSLRSEVEAALITSDDRQNATG